GHRRPHLGPGPHEPDLVLAQLTAEPGPVGHPGLVDLALNGIPVDGLGDAELLPERTRRGGLGPGPVVLRGHVWAHPPGEVSPSPYAPGIVHGPPSGTGRGLPSTRWLQLDSGTVSLATGSGR